MSLKARTRNLARMVLFAAVATCLPVVAHAQGYAIDWSSIAGGARTSTGDGYSLEGTIAQPEPDALAGGAFTVQGGFWVAPAVPTTSVATPGANLAADRLSAPRPNPFGRSTEVTFTLEREGPVRLDVYDLAGQRVRSLLDGRQAAGGYRVNWDGADGEGRSLAAGVYFLQLQVGARRTTQRVVRLH